MNKKSLSFAIAALVLGAALIIILIIAVLRSGTSPAPSASAPSGTATSTAATSTTAAPLPATGARRTSSAGTASTAPAPATANPITFSSPAAGTQWILQKQHTISWSRAAGSPGSLVLLDPTTNAVVGWIEQNIDLTQNSFPWDTQDVFLSQTSPLKKNILPGDYRVAITFASPNLPVVISPVFSVIPASAAATPTTTISLQNGAFSPSSVSVTKGTKLAFVNRDNVSYSLTITSSGGLTIPANGTQTFDTSVFLPGNYYYFYSTQYPNLRLTVAVENPVQ